VHNVNVLHEKASTVGQRVADGVTTAVGSWPFIITQSLILTAWIAANVHLARMLTLHEGHIRPWDAYPFILLNLVLSFQAAYTGPVVMMSQNRQALKDRLAAEQDFAVNVRAEQEVAVIMKELAHLDRRLLEVDRLLRRLVPPEAPAGPVNAAVAEQASEAESP